jgi:hypothetical protein
MEGKKRQVTIHEADGLLPTINTNLIELRELQKTLALLEDVEVDVEEQNYDSIRSLTKVNMDFHRLSYEFYQKLYHLERVGVVIKDLDDGIIDFFSKFEGRDVFLCWKMGEQTITHWHEVDEGFEQRKQMVDLEPSRQF